MFSGKRNISAVHIIFIDDYTLRKIYTKYQFRIDSSNLKIAKQIQVF